MPRIAAIAFGVRTAGGRYIFPPDIDERLDDRERKLLARFELMRDLHERTRAMAAEIDEDLLFYLRARGIPLATARAMLIESFVAEALEKVEDEAVRTALTRIALSRLATLSA